jgi:hypothetical protein
VENLRRLLAELASFGLYPKYHAPFTRDLAKLATRLDDYPFGRPQTSSRIIISADVTIQQARFQMVFRHELTRIDTNFFILFVKLVKIRG